MFVFNAGKNKKPHLAILAPLLKCLSDTDKHKHSKKIPDLDFKSQFGAKTSFCCCSTTEFTFTQTGARPRDAEHKHAQDLPPIKRGRQNSSHSAFMRRRRRERAFATSWRIKLCGFLLVSGRRLDLLAQSTARWSRFLRHYPHRRTRRAHLELAATKTKTRNVPYAFADAFWESAASGDRKARF